MIHADTLKKLHAEIEILKKENKGICLFLFNVVILEILILK